MPFEVIDALDPLTPLVDLHTSPVYELVMSVHTLLKPSRQHEAWARRARVSLSVELFDELTYLYQNFGEGKLYLELPVDYPDHDNVPGFLDYVRNLSDADFMFYIVGRTVSRDVIATMLHDASAVRQAILSAVGEHFEWYAQYLKPVMADIAGLRNRLVDAWQAYWTTFFQREVKQFEPLWAAGLQEKSSILSREGGRALYEKVTGRTELPHELPPNTPFRSITFTPVCLLPSRVYLFFGYGNITVLFDPQFTEDRRIAVERGTQEAIATIKALDDETRLKILQMIAQRGDKYHGKAIAEKLNISASAVSRHLALLREGNLIAEEPHDNLIRYRFQRETLTALVDKLLDYLYS